MDWKKWVIISGTIIAIGAVGTTITPAMRFFLGDSNPYYTPCDDDLDCGGSEFCKLTDCAAPGRCAPTPAACDSDAGPICGCDGSIYWNKCQLELSEESTDILNACITPMADNSLLVDPAMFTGLTQVDEGAANTANAISGSKKWVSFYDLGPVEGLYGLTAAQDNVDNAPLNSYVQIGSTERAISGYRYGTRPPAKWLVDIQNSGTYKLYVRRSDAGAGPTVVKIDEGELDTTGAASLDTNICTPCYDWWQLGQVVLSAGVHWFDFNLGNSTWDSVLISADTDFSVNDTDVLAITADYDSDPQTYGIRYTRGETIINAAIDTDSQLAHLIIVKDISDAWNEDLGDFEIIDTDPAMVLGTNHQGSLSFKILAGSKGNEVQLSATAMHNADSDVIAADKISLRVAKPVLMHSWLHVSDQSAGNWEMDNREIALTLVHDARTATFNTGWNGTIESGFAYALIEPHTTASFWITIDPAATINDGTYTGLIHIRDLQNKWIHTTLPIHVVVNDVALLAPAGTNGIFYPYSGNELSSAAFLVTQPRFAADLDYIESLGFDSFSLFQGYLVRDTDNNVIINEYDPETAFTKDQIKPPINMGPVEGQISTNNMYLILQSAEATGFDFPYVRFFEYDEASDDTAYSILDSRLTTTKATEALVQDTDSRYVIQSMATFNNAEACTVTPCDYTTPCDTDDTDNDLTFIDRVEAPLFSWVTPLQTYVDLSIAAGYEPRSYWTVQSTSPVAQRLTAGYQNQARGFNGIQAVRFQTRGPDVTWDEYDLNDTSSPNSVSYPDEFYNPIPTRRGEALGEGLLDARYYQLLENWVEVTNGCAAYGDTDTSDTDKASTVLRANDLFDVISVPYSNNTFVTRWETNYGPTQRRVDITGIVIELQNTWSASGPDDTDNIDTADCVDTGT